MYQLAHIFYRFTWSVKWSKAASGEAAGFSTHSSGPQWTFEAESEAENWRTSSQWSVDESRPWLRLSSLNWASSVSVLCLSAWLYGSSGLSPVIYTKHTSVCLLRSLMKSVFLCLLSLVWLETSIRLRHIMATEVERINKKVDYIFFHLTLRLHATTSMILFSTLSTVHQS